MHRILAFLQGAYYVLSGIWPILHMPSFLAVTGPKTDLWLVHTVGALVVAIGIALLAAVRESVATAPVILLGLTSALALFAIDVIYVFTDTIDGVYLLDAAPELLLAIGWLVVASRRRAYVPRDREVIRDGILPPSPIR